jgi:hypothetical protein
LNLESRIIDGAAINPRWRSSLEAGDRQTGMFQLLGKMCSRSFASAAAGKTSFGADVDPTMQESSGRDHNALCAKPSSFQGLDT